jgi:hypothetical protein
MQRGLLCILLLQLVPRAEASAAPYFSPETLVFIILLFLLFVYIQINFYLVLAKCFYRVSESICTGICERCPYTDCAVLACSSARVYVASSGEEPGAVEVAVAVAEAVPETVPRTEAVAVAEPV